MTEGMIYADISATLVDIDVLKAQTSLIHPEDPMPEAGRKALLKDFVKMLSHEVGSRIGEDIEDVHKMRVATRRMRSALRLLEGYYKPKTVQKHLHSLKMLARYLGGVRDLDVMIHNLSTFAEQNAEQQDGLASIITKLDKRRTKARAKLIDYLDSDVYKAFVESFADFLTKPGKGVRKGNTEVITPYQVRHVLPTLLYEHLAQVRAYDTVLVEPDVEPLHELRIAFKRLRYTTSFFSDVLGSSGAEFVDEIKVVQDYLGHLNDLVVARDFINNALKLKKDQVNAAEVYQAAIEAEIPHMVAGFDRVWAKFNTRTVQSKLANALLVLR